MLALNLGSQHDANWLNGANPDTFRNGDNVLLDDTGDNLAADLIAEPDAG